MITVTAAPTPAIPSATPLVASGAPATSSASLMPNLSFSDIVDTLNPLQHIPVVSSAYRAAAGSSISATSEIAGDTLYGAMTGNALLSLATAAGDVAVKQITGASLGQNVANAYHSLTGAATAGASTGTTALVADSAAVSQAKVAAQANAPAGSGAANALASATSADRFFKSLQTGASAAQYQRAQTLDAGNKMLLKMAV